MLRLAEVLTAFPSALSGLAFMEVDAIGLFRRASEEGVVVRPGTRFTTINRFRNGIRRKPVHRVAPVNGCLRQCVQTTAIGRSATTRPPNQLRD
jgi:hypothetical protein